MKKISSKKSLTRKVLCSVMAASMMGVAGTAFAAEYEKTIVPNYIVQDELDENSSTPTNGDVNDNITVNVNELCVTDPEEHDYEFIGAVNLGDITWNLGGEGKTVTINVDGRNNKEAEVIGVLADDGATINIKGSTTINTIISQGEYGSAIVVENGSSVNVTGDTIKLYGDVEATTGGKIKLTGKTVTGDYIRLHNDYDFNPGYQKSAHNSLTITADNITFKDYEGLSTEGMDEKDVARDSGQPVVYVNNSDLTMTGNVTISNAEGKKVLLADPIGKDMEYYALRATDGSIVTLGKDSSSKVDITGDVVVEGLPWIDTEDRPDPHTIPTDGRGKESCLTVNGAATVKGNVVVMHGSEVTFANSANITGRIWNGIDADAAKEGEIGYMHSNIADGGARKDGGILTINGGTINGTVFTGGGAKTILKNVTITTDTKVENDALTIENATVNLTNTTINGGLGVRSGSLTMDGGAINGVARSEMHEGDFEKTEIDIQTGTAELTDTNINAVILVGMPGEDPNVYPSESSKLVLNGNNETTVYTPEYLLVGPKGTLEIEGGTLKANELKKMTSVFGETSREGGIVLNGGIISTLSGQIFENSIDTTSEEAAIASKASGAVTNKVIRFVSGTLQLNDSLYTTDYRDSAIAALNNNNVELVMMGTLVKGAEPVVAITVENINEKVGAGTHDSVVLTAPEGSTSSVVVNSDIVTSGVGSVDLTNTSEKTFQVAGGKEFTLTGGATGAIVQGAESATVNVGEESKLNIGAQGKNVTLAGNLIADNGSAVDVRSNLVVAGNVTLNNAQLSAAEAEVSVKDLAVNAGSAITSAKAITADKLSMVSGQISAQALTVGAITQAKDSAIIVEKVDVTGDVAAENLNARALNIGGKLVSSGKLNATDITVTGVAEVAGATVANLTAGSLNATGVVLATDKVNVTGAATVANLTAKEFTVGGTTTVKGDLTADSINLKDVVVDAGGFTVNDSVVIGGTLKVNDGKVVLDNGTTDSGYNVGKITAGKAAAVEMKSGVIGANDLSTVIDSSSAAGGFVLNGGTISTLSGQIFEKAIDDTSEETAKACNDAGAITNKTITFTSGKLMFNEKYYTAAYKNSAITALNNEKVVIDWYNATKLDGKTTVGTLEELDKETQGSIENIEFKPTENKPVIINGDVKTQGIASVDLSKVDDKSVTIEGDKEFTIKGDANGNIITGTDNAELKVGGNGETVVNLGNDNKEAQLKGNIEAKPGATINIENTTNVVANDKKEGGKVKLEKATVNVKNGALHANEMALEHANLHSAVQAAVNVQQLTVAGETNITGNVNVTGDKEGKSELKVENGTGTVINVGADEAAGVVVADNTTLNGATLFLDPAYFNGIEKGSKFATGTTTLDGKYVAGRNSLIVFGEAKTDSAEKAFNATNLNWENVAAAVYLAAPITMDKDSALVVNGGLSDLKELGEVAEKSVTFADKSMLMVADAKPDTIAINGASTIEVKPDSKLMLIGAEDTKVYTVFGVDTENANEKARWAYENVISNEIAMTFVSASEEEGVFAGYKAKLDSLAAIYGDSVTAANVLDAVRVDKENKTAQDFFAAVGNDYGTKEARAKALNNVTTATAQAGVASSAIVANAEVANAIGDHLGFASVAEVGGNGARLNKENGSAVWAKLIHKKADVDGLKVGSIGKADYDVKQNGIVAGLDIVNTEDKAFGVAITYMDGKVTGAAAKNDTENYGLSVYGKKKVGKAAIIADLSYIHGENDIKAGTVTEKPKSDALSLGIKAETAIKSGVGQFVPYVGARVTRLGIGDYKDSIGIKHDSDVENLFNIPVGIKYSANIQKGNWTMRPTVDLGYVFNVGNKDGQETVSYGGASNTFSYEMVDKSSFVGALGFEVENKNVAYNLGYQYTKGDNTKAHKYMLGFKVKF